jgi:hypothetical protein
MTEPAETGRDGAPLIHLGPERPIGELMSAAALELRALCVAARCVEDAVESVIAEAGSLPQETVVGLQELDRMIQHMEGLADYVAALAAASPSSHLVDPTEARRALKLARLGRSLAGEPEPGERRDPAGAVELL